jgi:ribonucleoside-triphosphate reductase
MNVDAVAGGGVGDLEVTRISKKIEDEGKKINWGPIGEAVFNRTYPRRKIDGTLETWPETVKRVVRGNLALVPKDCIEHDEEAKLTHLLLNFGILPAGRHLSCSGIKGKQFLFNCHAAGWDPEDPAAHYTFAFDQLMQGGGVGSNYSNRYLYSLPKVKRKVNLSITCREDHPNISEFKDLLSNSSENGQLYFSVPDTREGWVEALELVLKVAYDYKGYEFTNLVVDVSDIRERGKPLVSSGGIACGPEPLVAMLKEFVLELNVNVGHHVGSLTAMKLDHIVASCVVAGGKRRSSRMSVKSWKDMDIFHFIACKDVDGDHWTTNISVETDEEFEAAYKAGDERAVLIMQKIAEGKIKNGEPGIWNISLAAKGEREPEKMFCPNPCGEIGLQMWENCNLGHVNLQYFAERPLKECVEAFRLMTRWLMRATFGDIPQDRQRDVVDENRRIGVGIVGYHGWLALNGIKYSQSWKSDFVKKRLLIFRQAVDNEAANYSRILDIPAPVKTTAIAPTGTIALLPGISASIQAIIAKWFKRLVRYFELDQELAKKKAEGYPTYKDRDAKSTEIVEFWCEDPLVSQVRARGLDPEELIESQDEISFEDSLEIQSMFQDLYANNAISYTINIPENKIPDVKVIMDEIMKRHHRLKGTTVFVDKTRLNAPFQRVTKEQFDSYTGPREIVQIEDECKTGCPVK